MSSPVAGSLRGKTAFVSGAGRNIGRAIAIELARRSCDVVVNGLSNRAECEETAALVRSAGHADALVVMGNVGERAFIEHAAQASLQRFGSVDIVINNAGVRPHTPFLTMSEDDWQSVLDINLNAAFRTCRAFLPGMVEKRWGRIVMITGRTAIEGYAQRVPVSVSKHGLWGMAKALAKEFGPKGITSNAISPGAVRRSDAVAPEVARRTESRVAEIPLGRIGEPEDIAALTAFLCSEEGGFINGQMIASNGGAAT